MKSVRGIGMVRIVMILLVTALGIHSCSVQAQSFKTMKYLGFETSFGVRSFKVNSNIKAIDKMQSGQEGGCLGIAFGNDLLMTKLTAAGFYYSNANTPRTQELFETSAQLNFYPIELIRSNPAKLRPYITTGISLDNVKFFGRYLETSGNTTTSAYEPLLGKLSQWTAHGGLGIEYCFQGERDFVHLFAEGTIGKPIQSTANTEAFKNTSISQFTSISIGASFGLKKRGR